VVLHGRNGFYCYRLSNALETPPFKIQPLVTRDQDTGVDVLCDTVSVPSLGLYKGSNVIIQKESISVAERKIMHVGVVLDVTRYRLTCRYQHFEETCCLNLQGLSITFSHMKHVPSQ
jgi:hypothetical protein